MGMAHPDLLIRTCSQISQVAHEGNGKWKEDAVVASPKLTRSGSYHDQIAQSLAHRVQLGVLRDTAATPVHRLTTDDGF